MKKTIINIVLIITALVIYFIQADFFSWFNIAGVKPNLFVIFILFIGLFSNRTMGAIYGMTIGLILDFAIGNNIGAYSIGLGAIGFLAAVFDKNFSKDSRMTIMVMVSGSTLIFEIFQYVYKYILTTTNVEILSFITILVIEMIFNILIIIILYPLIQKFGYIIENEYKGNKILTRYF